MEEMGIMVLPTGGRSVEPEGRTLMPCSLRESSET
jgi:hypothetical protein